MSYIGNVKVDSTTHLVGSTLYGTCNTGAGTKDKVVTCANFDKLLTGVTIHVKFDNTNTIADPTLNVNSTGAKAIKRYGTTAPSTTTSTSWNAGQVVSFTYDGTYWMMNDYNLDTDVNTHRAISVDGTQILANNTTTALNLKGGTNISINATSGSGDVTINANDTNIHRCTMDDSSTATAFVVNTNSNDSVTALKDGLTIYVKNTVITSKSGCTLNLNGLGAKRIWLSQSNSYCYTDWHKDTSHIFIYNAENSVWELQQGRDTVGSDINVRQSLSSDDENRPLLMCYYNNSKTSVAVDASVYRNNDIYANPSTGELHVPYIYTQQEVWEETWNSNKEKRTYIWAARASDKHQVRMFYQVYKDLSIKLDTAWGSGYYHKNTLYVSIPTCEECYGVNVSVFANNKFVTATITGINTTDNPRIGFHLWGPKQESTAFNCDIHISGMLRYTEPYSPS